MRCGKRCGNPDRKYARAEASAREAGVSAKTALIEARAGARIANVIADAARVWPADLIVIGTHGRPGVDRPLLGSVAEGVYRVGPGPADSQQLTSR